MGAMVAHMEALLADADAAQQALSFTVLVPHWKDVAAVVQLRESTWHRAGFVVAADAHQVRPPGSTRLHHAPCSEMCRLLELPWCSPASCWHRLPPPRATQWPVPPIL
jgi:hypothetical protein